MINAADRINAALTAEARDTLRTVISLDGFLALKGEERASRWRQMDRAGKWQLVALAFERNGFDWMPSEVEAGITHWDARYDSDLMIPALADILVVAKEQRATAVHQNDGATVRQLDRVIVSIACGAQLRWVLGDLHVASVNNPGMTYVLSCGRCNCPAFKPCWHMKLWDILLDMLDTAAGDADFEADADELAAIAELPTPAQLGQRLAAARQCYSEAA